MRIRDANRIRELLVVERMCPDRDAIARRIVQCAPILEGHFALQGGDHSIYFLRFSQLGRNDQAVEHCAKAVLGLEPRAAEADVILAPETAGFFFGLAVATALGKPLAVSRVDALRCPVPALRDGKILEGARVLIVNDVISTGRSLVPLRELVARSRGKLAGIFAFAVMRPSVLTRQLDELGIFGAWLTTTTWEVYPPGAEHCRGCKEQRELLPAAEFN